MSAPQTSSATSPKRRVVSAAIPKFSDLLPRAQEKKSILEANLKEMEARFGVEASAKTAESGTPEVTATPISREALNSQKQAAFLELQRQMAEAKKLGQVAGKTTPAEASLILKGLREAQQNFCLAMRAAEIAQLQFVIDDCLQIQDSQEIGDFLAIPEYLASLREDLGQLYSAPSLDVFESRMDEISNLIGLQASMLQILEDQSSSAEIKKIAETKLKAVSGAIFQAYQENLRPFKESFTGVTKDKSSSTQEKIDFVLEEFSNFASEAQVANDRQTSGELEINALKQENLKGLIAERAAKVSAKTAKTSKIAAEAEAKAKELSAAIDEQVRREAILDEEKKSLAEIEAKNKKIGFFKKALTAITGGRYKGGIPENTDALTKAIKEIESDFRQHDKTIGALESELKALNTKLGKDRVSGIQTELETFTQELESLQAATPTKRDLSIPAAQTSDKKQSQTGFKSLLRDLAKSADQLDLDPEMRKALQKQFRAEARDAARKEVVLDLVSRGFHRAFLTADMVARGEIPPKATKGDMGFRIANTVANQISIPVIQQGAQALVGIAQFIYKKKRQADQENAAGFALVEGDSASQQESLREGIIDKVARKIHDTYSLKTDGKSPLDLLTKAGLEKFTSTMISRIMDEITHFQLPTAAELPKLDDVRLKSDSAYQAELSKKYGIEIDAARLSNPLYFNKIAGQIEEQLYSDFIAEKLIDSVVQGRASSPRSEALGKVRFKKSDLANPQDRTFTFEGFTRRMEIVTADGQVFAPTAKKETALGLKNKYGRRLATKAEEDAIALSGGLSGYTAFTPIAQTLEQEKKALLDLLKPEDFLTAAGLPDAAAFAQKEEKLNDFLQDFNEAKIINPRLNFANYVKDHPFSSLATPASRGLFSRTAATPQELRNQEVQAALSKVANAYVNNESSKVQERALQDFSRKQQALLSVLRPVDFKDPVTAEEMPAVLGQLLKDFTAQKAVNKKLDFATFLKSPESPLNTGAKSTFGIFKRGRDLQRRHFNANLKTPLEELLAAHEKLLALDVELPQEDFRQADDLETSADAGTVTTDSTPIAEDDVDVELVEPDLFAEVDEIEADGFNPSPAELPELAEFSDEPTVKREGLRLAPPVNAGLVASIGRSLFGAAKSVARSVDMPDLIPDELSDAVSRTFSVFARAGERVVEAAEAAAEKLTSYPREFAQELSEFTAPFIDSISQTASDLASTISDKTKDFSKQAADFAETFEEQAKDWAKGPGGEKLATTLMAHALKIRASSSAASSKTQAFEERKQKLLGLILPSDLKDPTLTADPATALMSFAEGYHAQVMAGANRSQLRLYLDQNLPVQATNSVLAQEVAGFAALYSDATMAKAIARRSVTNALVLATSGAVGFVADAIAPTIAGKASDLTSLASENIGATIGLSESQQELLTAKVAEMTGKTISAKLADSSRIAANKVRVARGDEAFDAQDGEAEEGILASAVQVRENKQIADASQKALQDQKAVFLTTLTSTDFINPEFATNAEGFLENLAQRYFDAGLDPETSSSAELQNFFTENSVFKVVGNDALRESLVTILEDYKTAQIDAETYKASLASAAESVASDLASRVIDEATPALVGKATSLAQSFLRTSGEKLGADLPEDAESFAAQLIADGAEFAGSELADRAGRMASDLVLEDLEVENEADLDPIKSLLQAKQNLEDKALTFAREESGFLADRPALSPDALHDFFIGYDSIYNSSLTEEEIEVALNNYVATNPVSGAQSIEDQEHLKEIANLYVESMNAAALEEEAIELALSSIKNESASRASDSLESAAQEAEALNLVEAAAEIAAIEQPMPQKTSSASALDALVAREAGELGGTRLQLSTGDAALSELIEGDSLASDTSSVTIGGAGDDAKIATKAEALARLNKFMKSAGSLIAFKALVRMHGGDVLDGKITLAPTTVAAEGVNALSLSLKVDRGGDITDIELNGGDKGLLSLGTRRQLFNSDGSVKPKHLGTLDELLNIHEKAFGISHDVEETHTAGPRALEISSNRASVGTTSRVA